MAVLLAIAAARPLLAAEIQEVVVYSTLDESLLADTPASISVFDEAAMRRQNMQHVEHLLGASPNVNYSGGAARARFVQVRGIGDIEQFVDPKAHPSVGLVVDGIDFSGLFGAALLFDSQQVEVARGPQGTAMGSSALAGSINIVSKRASVVREGFVETGVGKFSSRQVGGAISAPLSDNSAARLAVRQYRSDGYIENTFLQKNNTGRLDEFLGKLSLDFEGDEGESLALNIIHIDNDNGYDAFSLGNTGWITRSDQPGNDKQRVLALGATFSEPVFSNSEIEYSLSWLQANTLYSYDEDWVDPGFCSGPCTGGYSGFDQYRRLRNDYSVEFKLVNPGYLMGFFGQDRQVDLDRDRSGDFPLAVDSQYDTERLALFAQWSPNPDNALRFVLGGRYEWFKDDYTDTASTVTDSRDELWQANASLNYRLSREADLYLLASRGNKAGGVNTDATTNIDSTSLSPAFEAELIARQRYASESLANYELGINFGNDDASLQGRIALFYNYRNNPQFETFLYDTTNFIFVGYLDNAGEAESHGIEIQFRQQLSSWLLLEYSAAYMDSSLRKFRINDFDLGAFRTVSSREQPRAPGYQYHVATTFSLTDSISATLSAEGRDSYQYAYYFNEESGHINLLHFSLQYRGERASVTGWLRNFRNEAYPVQGLYFPNDPSTGYPNELYEQLGEPRNGGVTFRYNF